MDVMDQDFDDAEEETLINIEDTIKRNKEKIKKLEAQEKMLKTLSDKIKAEINKILEKQPQKPDPENATVIERVKNRDPSKVDEVNKKLQQVSPIVEIRDEIKKL